MREILAQKNKLLILWYHIDIVKKILFYLLILSGLAVLLVAANYTFFSPNIPFVLRLIFFLLLLIDATCYFATAWGIFKNIKWLFWPTIVLLVLNTLAAIFDDFGLVDALASAFNLLVLISFIFWSKLHQNN